MSVPSLSAPAAADPTAPVAGGDCTAAFSAPGNASRLPRTPPRRNNSRRVIIGFVMGEILREVTAASSVAVDCLRPLLPAPTSIEAGSWKLGTGSYLEEELQHQLHG